MDELADDERDDGDPEHPERDSRQRRNLVQSDILRWVVRSTPPKTFAVQNR